MSSARVDGKFLRVDDERFRINGVTYGTFAPGELGQFPDRVVLQQDFAAMAETGINTVRTYTVPPLAVLDEAAAAGLMVLAGIDWPDARWLDPPSDDSWRAMAAAARDAVRHAAESIADHPAVLALVVGNEIPGPTVRWFGRRRMDGLLRSLCDVGRTAAPDVLLAYANYPTTQYLDTSCFDFDCMNVFLEGETAFRWYLSQLQIEAGRRPLVLTEIGLDAGAHGDACQADVLAWQLRAALELGAAGTCVFSWTDDWWVGGHEVAGWSFGLTTCTRRPRPALTAVREAYHGGLLGTRPEWPPATVVVCAHNEEKTIGACLDSLEHLRYPDYDVICVDDGSRDGTADIARRHPVTLVSEGHGGLCRARNLGLERATGDVVAYIDADATADPDWLTYLAISLDPQATATAGAGGPNWTPPEDPLLARCIGLAPGNPVHVLIDDERADHIPGCNMAFRRRDLLAIGGFDPTFHTAGDDVDVCWRLLDEGRQLRFHPAALVWHHPRRTVRTFWRQQVGYGAAESLVSRNHPDRFSLFGSPRWRGVVYGPVAAWSRRGTVDAGPTGDAPFQRMYPSSSSIAVLPAMWVVLASTLLIAVHPALSIVPIAAALALVVASLTLGMRAAARARLPARRRCGAVIGLLHLMQPIAREFGRLRARHLSFPSGETGADDRAAVAVARRLLRVDGVRDRVGLIADLRDRLRRRRIRASRRPIEAGPRLDRAGWEQADVASFSPFAWEVRLDSYLLGEVCWLRLHRRLRSPRALATMPVVAIALGAWSFALVLEALAVVMAAVWIEGRWFERRVVRALTGGRRA
jgi:hypothetical protein